MDDPDLLKRMMAELCVSDVLYRPTNYWAHYEKRFLPELMRCGLRDFRRRHESILASFGASDIRVKGRVKMRKAFRGAGPLTRVINRIVERLPFIRLDVEGLIGSDITEFFYHHVKRKYEDVGLDLTKCPTSLYGNPEDTVVISGGCWSMAHLQYCSMYVDAARFIQLPENAVVCELGGGMGRNVEVIAGLYADATLLLFDIPPQLYVANQYLSRVFGSRVIDYREAVGLHPGADGRIPDEVRGRVVILPTWRMPAWSSTKIDLFWNSASFQEMETGVVRNYLSLVKRMNPEWIYINALPEGNYWGEWKPGRGGTKEPVLDECYVGALRPEYGLAHTYDTEYFLRKPDYKSYVLERVSRASAG